MSYDKEPKSLTQEMQVQDYYDRLELFEKTESELKAEYRRNIGEIDALKENLQSNYKSNLEVIHRERQSLEELKRTINRQSVIIF